MAKKTNQPSQLVVSGKDELNLAEFPIGRLGVRDNRETITYEGWLTNKQGQRYKQIWNVSAPKQYGLPHELGNRMLVTFISLAAEQQSREVTFMDWQMLKLLRLSDGKENYKAFERNLLQLAALTIYSEKALWDNENKKHTTSKEAFHVFEHVWLSSWVDDDTGQPKGNGYVVFNEVFWRNIQSGYLKTLNLEEYLSLKNPIARQLYRCLDKLMRYRTEFEIDIFTLAAKIGLMVYKYPSQLLQKLKPGLDELIERGFLASAERVQVGKYTRLRFVKGAAQKLVEEEPTEEIAPPTQDSSTTHTRGTIEPRKTWKETWQDKVQQHDVPPEYQELWLQVLTLLESQINRGSFLAFVSETILLSIEGDTAVILTNNPFSEDWLRRQMSKQFTLELNLFLRESGREKISSVRIVPAGGQSN